MLSTHSILMSHISSIARLKYLKGLMTPTCLTKSPILLSKGPCFAREPCIMLAGRLTGELPWKKSLDNSGTLFFLLKTPYLLTTRCLSKPVFLKQQSQST